MNQSDTIDNRRIRVLPMDEIAPRHLAIECDLDAWGRWSRERQAKRLCGSAERSYQPRNGNVHMGPEYPEYVVATPPGIPNPRNQQIDRAVAALPRLHLTGFRLHYWHRVLPEKTCRLLTLRPENFGGFMAHGRDMVINILRRQLGNC